MTNLQLMISSKLKIQTELKYEFIKEFFFIFFGMRGVRVNLKMSSRFLPNLDL